MRRIADLTLVLVLGVAPVVLAQAPPGVPATDSTVSQIRPLLEKLLQTQDLDEQERLVKQMLAIDPAQPVAVQKLAEISQLRREQAQKREVDRKTAQARSEVERQKSQDKAAATAGLVSSLSGGGGLAELRAAQAAVQRVLAADGKDTEALNLKGRIDGAIRSRYIQLGTYAGLTGTVLVGAVVGLVIRHRNRKTVLRVVHGQQTGEVFVIPADKERVVIGTLQPPAVDFSVIDPTRRVSRQHCQITRSGRQYFLANLSANGTTLNRRAVTRDRPTPLRRGDEISLAGEVTLRFS